MAGVVGTHVIAGKTGTPRKTLNAFAPMASEVQLVHRERSPTPSSTLVPAGEQGHLLVDGVESPPRENALRGAPTPPELRLYSDASRSGWRAHLLDQSASGLWSHQETSLHINILGDEGSVPGASSLPGHDHRQASDSNVRQLHGSGLRQQTGGGTVSDALCELTGQLLRWTEAHNVLLEARYLPGQSNVLADLLSRRNQVLGAEWSLLPQVEKIIRTWGSPTIDLFATHLNAKLPLYCSLIPVPQAVFEDAFRHSWNHLDVYAFPPFHLVERVVARVRETPNLSMTLVGPLWLEKSWFADLLLTQPPLALPPWDRLLRQPHFHRFHRGVHALNFHAWRLSSISSKSQDFRDKLLASCPDVSESPLHACTSRNCSPSVVGVVERALLRSTPLYP